MPQSYRLSNVTAKKTLLLTVNLHLIAEGLRMEVTLLGTGTSQGIPVIACECAVCASDNPKDKRLRASIMLSQNGRNLIIDSGPDFREQMLREKVMSIEGIVYTHEHKDHVAGMDDVRAFNYKLRKDMMLYGSERVEKALRREFHYAFEEKRYPGVPEVVFNRIGDEAFEAGPFRLLPINVLHYKLPVQAFRIGDFAYVTDANYIAPEEKAKLKGIKFLVLNALRKERHPSHFSLNEALELIRELQPAQTWLTHISHLMGLHDEVSKELPPGVSIGFDGLKFEINSD